MADLDLGTDLKVAPDMPDTEDLVLDVDCLAQDLLLRLDNPRGLADGTEEGNTWGYDLPAQLNRGATPRGLLELLVEVEAQVEQDDRVSRCRANRSYYDPASLALYLILDVEIGEAPYSMSIRCTSETLALLEA